MSKKKSEEAIRQFMRIATPEEQREFTSTLLDAEARRNQDPEIPQRYVRVNRLLLVALAASHVLASGWSSELLHQVLRFFVPFVIAWFPNQTSSAAARLDFGVAVGRMTFPWITLVLVWIVLLTPFLQPMLAWLFGIT